MFTAALFKYSLIQAIYKMPILAIKSKTSREIENIVSQKKSFKELKDLKNRDLYKAWYWSR